MWSSALCFVPQKTGPTSHVWVFLSHLSDLPGIIIMHKNNKKETCHCRMKWHFSRNKLYMHDLQKELRMGIAWRVNTNPHSPINIVTEMLLSFGCCISRLSSRKKNQNHMWACHFCSFRVPLFFFFAFPLCQNCTYPYIILYFLFWNFSLNHNIEEPVSCLLLLHTE